MPPYQQVIDRFGLIAQEQLVCGCHVHVEIDSDEEGLAVVDATVLAMVDSRTILDENMAYFDTRLSPHQPTLKVRIADVCLRCEDAVLLAALVRALVETAARAWRAGEPPAAVRVEQLRLAAWRAGKSGLDGELLNGTGRPSPADVVLRTLIQRLRPALEEPEEPEVAQNLATALLHRGNGANAQQRIYRSTARLSDVVAYAVKQTVDS